MNYFINFALRKEKDKKVCGEDTQTIMRIV